MPTFKIDPSQNYQALKCNFTAEIPVILSAMVERITIKPGKRFGQPCVRGLRITVLDVLTWLAAGMSEQTILEDYPELEPEDFRAVYKFAAQMGRRVAL